MRRNAKIKIDTWSALSITHGVLANRIAIAVLSRWEKPVKWCDCRCSYNTHIKYRILQFNDKTSFYSCHVSCFNYLNLKDISL